MNIVNAMLISSGLHNNLQGEALYFAYYILNRVPYKNLDKTPYEF